MYKTIFIATFLFSVPTLVEASEGPLIDFSMRNDAYFGDGGGETAASMIQLIFPSWRVGISVDAVTPDQEELPKAFGGIPRAPEDLAADPAAYTARTIGFVGLSQPQREWIAWAGYQGWYDIGQFVMCNIHEAINDANCPSWNEKPGPRGPVGGLLVTQRSMPYDHGALRTSTFATLSVGTTTGARFGIRASRSPNGTEPPMLDFRGLPVGGPHGDGLAMDAFVDYAPIDSLLDGVDILPTLGVHIAYTFTIAGRNLITVSGLSQTPLYRKANPEIRTNVSYSYRF